MASTGLYKANKLEQDKKLNLHSRPIPLIIRNPRDCSLGFLLLMLVSKH